MTDSQLDKYKKMLEEFKRQLKEKRGNLNLMMPYLKF
ncbi:hypothetical protein GYH30_027383 [Glycine max]|nr:hypothetical protein GYH30_027383 [Glycine max]